MKYFTNYLPFIGICSLYLSARRLKSGVQWSETSKDYVEVK